MAMADSAGYVPRQVLLMAGTGEYPLEMIRGMRKAGVARITVMGYKGGTSRAVLNLADEVRVFRLGEFKQSLEWMASTGIRYAAMAGQLTPLALFRARFDALSKSILAQLPVKNAHTVFGAWIQQIERIGLRMMPASSFMDDCLPGAGTRTNRAPSEGEFKDIQVGHSIALDICDLDIGQTILVKAGMVLAVEAFEGTNEAIRRGGKLGGGGSVLVKVAKKNHDMRFDIPVIGTGTIKRLRRYGVTALAYQAKRLIMLNPSATLTAANRAGIAIVGIDSGLPPAPTRPVPEV